MRGERERERDSGCLYKVLPLTEREKERAGGRATDREREQERPSSLENTGGQLCRNRINARLGSLSLPPHIFQWSQREKLVWIRQRTEWKVATFHSHPTPLSLSWGRANTHSLLLLVRVSGTYLSFEIKLFWVESHEKWLSYILWKFMYICFFVYISLG